MKAVYTAISGNRDFLPSIKYPNSNFDYICFTTEKDIKTDKIWKIIYVDKILNSCVKTARKYKILSHEYLKDYNITLWIDANMCLYGNVEAIVNDEIKDCYFAAYQHPSGDLGPYHEINRCISFRKDSEEILSKQRGDYRDIGVPDNIKLPQTGIIIRRTNNERIKIFEDIWWQQIEKYSCRDQVAFCYAQWKSNVEWKTIKTSKNNWFKIGSHQKRK